MPMFLLAASLLFLFILLPSLTCLSLGLPFLALLFGLLSLSVCLHALDQSRYWRKRGIPGPQSLPFLGNINDIFGFKLCVLQLREWTRQFGPVYGIQQGWTNILVVSEVQMLSELFNKKFEFFHGRKVSPMRGNPDSNPLLSMFDSRGHRWKRLRAISSPLFTVGSLKKILPILQDSCREMMVFIDRRASQMPAPFNIHPFFHELTMDVIARIALGQSESMQFRTGNTAMTRRVMSNIDNNAIAYLSWIFPRLWRLLRLIDDWTWRIRDEPFQSFTDQVGRIVEQRKSELDSGGRSPENREGKQQVDFIDMFLETETKDILGEMENSDGIFKRLESKNPRKMTIQEIATQLRLFLLAGFDTTANTLAITCWYLARNPEAQAKLQNEIDGIWEQSAEKGEEMLTYEQLGQMNYAEAVMREVLRLQPIAANIINRVASETTTLGDYVVEKGTVVHVDLFSVHLDKTIWGEDAELFRPERWLSAELNSRPTMKWLPFGAGPRMCLGMRLAYMEQKLALANLLGKYSIVRCAQTEEELKLSGQSVFNPESVTIQLELRRKRKNE